MQTPSSVRKTESYRPLPSAEPQPWRVIRTDSRSRRMHRIRCRKWRRVRAQAGRSMMLFGPLFFLVWITVSMLSPQDHLFAGIILLLILAAEAVSAIVYMVSDALLQYLHPDR